MKTARLSAEIDRLRAASSQTPPHAAATQTIVVGPQGPSDAEIAEQRREAIVAEQAARRQQLIQAWMGLQGLNRTQNVNVNFRNCTVYPALCAGR